MIMRWSHVGIIGASGFTGAELLRLSPPTPTSTSPLATGDTQAGDRGGRRCTRRSPPPTPTCVLRAASTPTCRRRARRRVPRPAPPGVDGAGAAARRPGRLRRRPVGDFRLKDAGAVPAVVRLRATTSPSCSPRPSTACPSCPATSSSGARLVATPGCYVTAATLALRPAARAGLVEPTGSSSTPPAACPAPAGPPSRHHVLHRRRELHRLRPARPPPHAGDRAEPRRRRCCSRRTWRR